MICFQHKSLFAYLGGLALLVACNVLSPAEMLTGQDVKPSVNADSQASETQFKPAANQRPESRFKTRSNPALVKFDEVKVPKIIQREIQNRGTDVPIRTDDFLPSPTLKPIQTPTANSPARVQTAVPAVPRTPWKPGLTPLQRHAIQQHDAAQQRTIDSPVMVSKSSNTIATEIKSPKYINVNQTAPIQISLQNFGRNAVENVVLSTTIPAHTKLASASPQPTRSQGNTFEFDVPHIGAEDVREIVLYLVPSEKRPLELSTQVRVETSQRVLVAVRQPELKLVINGPKRTNLGQTVIHELVVANVGDGVATDVKLNMKFPEQLRMLKQSADSTILRIEPGKSTTIQFESLAQESGSVEFKIVANSQGVETRESAVKLDILQPELRVSAVGPKRNFVKQTGVYTIDVENTGEVDINNVQVSMAIPAGLRVTTISRQAVVDADKGILTWTFGTIASKSSEKVRLKAIATQEGSQVCNIMVSSTETREKEFQLATQVATRADLSVRIKNQTGPVQVGGKAVFLVEVENMGTRRASGINVRVELPDSLKPVQTDREFVEQKDNTILFIEPQISPGQKVAFKFTAVVSEQGEHVVRSSLETEESTRRLVSEDIIFVYEVDEARISESLSPTVPKR